MQELTHPRDEFATARSLWNDGASPAQGGTDLDYQGWLMEQILIELRMLRLSFGISLEPPAEEGEDEPEDEDGADPA